MAGRKKSENPKDIQYRLRMDKETADELEYLHVATGMCKSALLRKMIHNSYKMDLALRLDKERVIEDLRKIGREDLIP